MRTTRPSRAVVLVAALGALAALSAPAAALTPDKDGWYKTGSGTRVKKVAFVEVDVYQITHWMKGLPPAKSKRAVIDADTDKKIVFKMLRDVDMDKIVGTLKEGFARNGYGDAGRIAKFLAAFSGDEIEEDETVTIVYDAGKKATSVAVKGHGSATVDTADFMKGVWSLWFGKLDQPSLGDDMISKW